jgi:hypothetical protein
VCVGGHPDRVGPEDLGNRDQRCVVIPVTLATRPPFERSTVTADWPTRHER